MTLTSVGPPRDHHVLLVDDCRAMLKLHSRFLEADGYRVTVADSAAAGLDVLRRETPDLIVLDYMMPEMDGGQMLQQIRATKSLEDVPAVFLTASSLEIGRAFELGATDYFTKPIDRRILSARVRALIANHRLTKIAALNKDLAAQNERLRAEIAEARNVQQAQLPRMPARFSGWLATGALLPCNNVGGDIFDVIPGPGDSRTVALVDVSGHGLASAMVASSIRGALRLLVQDLPLGKAVEQLNALLCQASEGHYACIALCQITGNRVQVINAGLPPVVALENGRVVWSSQGAGFPPGLIAGADYAPSSFTMTPDMRLVVMSDGVTEPFGYADETDKPLDVMGLTSEKDRDPAPLADRVGRLFNETGARQQDDATVVMLERDPDAKD